jgi:hypothetical protein
MTTFRVVPGRTVHNLDTSLEPQLHKPNRLSGPGRVMGDSPGIHGRLLGGPPAFAGPCNISQAYGRPAEGSFSVFGPIWEVGKQQLALGSGKRTARSALYERFPRA